MRKMLVIYTYKYKCYGELGSVRTPILKLEARGRTDYRTSELYKRMGREEVSL